MKSTIDIVIRKELIDAGASRSEDDELTLLANDLAKLKKNHSFVKPSRTRPRKTNRGGLPHGQHVRRSQLRLA